MSQEMQSFEPTQSDVPMSTFQTWIAAVTKPSPETYTKIANDPSASPGKAYLWVFLAGLLVSLVTAIIQSTTIQQTLEQSGLGVNVGSGTILITLVCGIPVLAALYVVIFAVWIALIQLVARMFGGQGNYNQLLYASSAIYVPVAAVSSVINLLYLIPVVGFCFAILAFALSIYSLVLSVMAVKGVNAFGWGAAIGAAILPGLVIFLIVFCCVALSLIALGPRIGNVFSEITPGFGGY
jgi:hypothetical protein